MAILETLPEAPGNPVFLRLHFLDVDFQWEMLLDRKLAQYYSTSNVHTYHAACNHFISGLQDCTYLSLQICRWHPDLRIVETNT